MEPKNRSFKLRFIFQTFNLCCTMVVLDIANSSESAGRSFCRWILFAHDFCRENKLEEGCHLMNLYAPWKSTTLLKMVNLLLEDDQLPTNIMVKLGNPAYTKWWPRTSRVLGFVWVFLCGSQLLSGRPQSMYLVNTSPQKVAEERKSP